MKAEDIFLAALDKKAPGERKSYLDGVCGDDDELRAQVEGLLRSHHEAGSFLNAPLFDSPPTIDQPVIEKAGTQIGPYKLLQQIGEGGFGVVFMAEQVEPVRRRVALKVIKPGMDSRQVIARFEAERQALSLMDHPNIARVLDGGTTESGRPYFVMELVRGQPITQYCDEHHLTPRQRLELLLPVCQAIQHAHQKGIIHRDIKPSNILVAEYDQQPVPKVIDFGVAKAVCQSLTDKTMFTGLGQIVGTLEYMSPEQAKVNQLDIDTRSDIYSLGVLLYELLTGSTPFDKQRLRSAGWDEMLRIIREEEPPKPSTKLSSSEALPSVAANRSMEPARLSRSVRGELDWIAMKALEKDRNRRYETANGLAQDLQRYLANEPVQACPPSAAYRLRKFAQRNKARLAPAGLIAFFVVLLGCGLIWASRDRAARRLLVEEAADRALEQAGEFQDQGKWQEALAAVERAEVALANGEGRADLHKQVQDKLIDLHMIQRLEECRLERGESLETAPQSEAYAKVFADYGIGLEGPSPPEVAALIRRRPDTTVRVAAALDDWALVLRDSGFTDPTKDPAAWKRLLEIARLADSDPWRGQLRQLIGQEDLKALEALADTSDVKALPPQSLQLMGSALVIGGDRRACTDWLRKAHRQRPADALIAFELAFHLSNLPAPDWNEVLRFAEAALAARPSPATYHMVGIALSKLKRHDEAISVLRKACESRPDFKPAVDSLRDALAEPNRLRLEKEQLDVTVAECAKSLDACPEMTTWNGERLSLWREAARSPELIAQLLTVRRDPYGHIAQGMRWAEQGRIPEAAEAYVRVLDVWPDRRKDQHWGSPRMRVCVLVTCWPDVLNAVRTQRPNDQDIGVAVARQHLLHRRWEDAHAAFDQVPREKLTEQERCEQAGLSLLCGKTEEYQQACLQVTDRLKPDNPPWNLMYGARLCALGTCEGHDPHAAIEWAERGLRMGPQHDYFPHTLALIHFRAHQYDSARHWIDQSKSVSTSSTSLLNEFLLAMIDHHEERIVEAQARFSQACQKLDSTKVFGNDRVLRFPPIDWIEVHVLQREAADLIAGPLQEKGPTKHE